jgi:hypothetical protein
MFRRIISLNFQGRSVNRAGNYQKQGQTQLALTYALPLDPEDIAIVFCKIRRCLTTTRHYKPGNRTVHSHRG